MNTTNFENGFRAAIALFKSGETWELISSRPEYDASMYGRGMFAAVEAMGGWLALAEREAKTWGVSPSTTAALIEEARAA